MAEIIARKGNVLIPDAVLSTWRYVDKDIISARCEEETRQNEVETPKTKLLWSELSWPQGNRVKSWCFTFDRIIRFAVEKRKKKKGTVALECLAPHAKSNTLQVTGILSDNRSNGSVLWATGRTRDCRRKQNGQLYSIKGKSCLKAGQRAAVCGETKEIWTRKVFLQVIFSC